MIKRTNGDGTALVTFELSPEAGADTAAVSGEFNGWTSSPLDRDDDGWFRLTVPLGGGRTYRFRYLLDGRRWENDWAPDFYMPNAFGGDDSVVDLRCVSTERPPATDGS